jgi:hypothetical protein
VSVAGGGPQARCKSARVGCPCPRLSSGEARSRPLCGPILDLIAPIRPLQLCANGGYQLRLGVLRVPLIMVPDICGIQGCRYVRLVEGFVAARSVRRLDPRISGNRRISSRLRRRSSSLVRTSIVVPRVSSFLHFPIRAGPPSLSPHLPRRRRPSPSVSHPRWRPFPPPRRRRRWPPAAPAFPCSRVRAPLSGGGGRAPRAPCGRARPRPARPDLPCAAPSSLFHGWEEEDERKNTMAVS